MSYCNNEIKIEEWHFSVSDPFALLDVIEKTKAINDRVNNKTFLSKEQEEQARECVKDVRGIVTSERTVPSQEACGKMAKPLTTPAKQEEKEGKSL